MRGSLWWQCEHGHIGCVDGRSGNNVAQLKALMLRTHKVHSRREPMCTAKVLRVSKTKHGLNVDNQSVTFEIERKLVTDEQHRQHGA